MKVRVPVAEQFIRGLDFRLDLAGLVTGFTVEIDGLWEVEVDRL